MNQTDIDKIHKLISALNSRIDDLEAKISKLESAPATNNIGEREVIIAHKKVTAGGADNDYFKTSKGRILLDCSPRYSSHSSEYEATLKNVLISINDEMEPKSGESIDTFIARVRAKYCTDPTLPVLLGGYVMFPNGSLWSVRPTNKNIKF